MSYDITFRVKVEGVNCWVEPMVCDANITWNVKEMIQKSTGLDWLNEADNGLCVEIIPNIERGIYELFKQPEKYKIYDESNNLKNTAAKTLHFLNNILVDWKKFKIFYPELVPLAHFWIY